MTDNVVIMRSSRLKLSDKKEIENYPSFDPDGDEKHLFEAIRDDRLIVFFGAGVSRLAGCQSWAGLAKEIVSAYPEDIFTEEEKKALIDRAERDSKNVISICYHQAKEQQETGDGNLMDIYEKAIIESVTPKDPDEFARIHNKIFELDAISYVTTNIDKGIEIVNKVDIRGKEKFNLTTENDWDRIQGFVRNGNIFYLHGTFDDIGRTVFSVDKYYGLYARSISRSANSFLRYIFGKGFTVLFIGYGLEEPEILQNIFMAGEQERSRNRQPQHFILTSTRFDKLVEFNIDQMLLDVHSVKAIPYFTDSDEGYGRLHYALSKLIGMKEKYKRPTMSDIDDVDSV